MTYSVVIPTVGRASLADCLRALAESAGPAPAEVVVVDDRPLTDCGPLGVGLDRVDRVVYSCGNGPAAARNAGWRATTTPWVVFLDDDVVPSRTWAADLARDLDEADPATAAVQGRITVPLPAGRRPTDFERNTAGLETSRWITADIAYRRSALAAVSGFDERFPRAFREDADLALRVADAGWGLTVGRRVTVHPVRTAGPLVSVSAQAGNADDVLMRRLHGADWAERAEAPRGRITRHAVIAAAGAAAVGLAVSGRRRAALAAAGAWAVGTAEFAAARIAPGPRSRSEVLTMLATSAVIPFAAVGHRLRGEWRHRRATPWPPPAAAGAAAPGGSVDTSAAPSRSDVPHSAVAR
ncbi:glycosyltransferase family 2 protein [Cryptosporangium phraense]|uniref:Glycosyltransferase n=1 Tax=Cryptosporangium phraense TaxID=2593070 RepID=A0A545AX80_9ACTN|nr:glycosyltransferase [Cryptosporangium phraense]TQS45943.1 glycosyltransferase [Cryptosporangium phraense]